jgi:hypothetical protein
LVEYWRDHVLLLSCTSSTRKWENFLP